MLCSYLRQSSPQVLVVLLQNYQWTLTVVDNRCKGYIQGSNGARPHTECLFGSLSFHFIFPAVIYCSTYRSTMCTVAIVLVFVHSPDDIPREKTCILYSKYFRMQGEPECTVGPG